MRPLRICKASCACALIAIPTEEEARQIYRKRHTGFSVAELAAHYSSLTALQIRNILIALEHRSSKLRGKHKLVIKGYKNGESLRILAHRFEVSKTTIKETLLKHGVTLRRHNRKGDKQWQHLTAREKLLKSYGLTPEDFQAMLTNQKGKCWICSRDFSDKCRPNIDHCHRTDKVRGLLCRGCNTGLGLLKDDTTALFTALCYLVNHGKSHGPQFPASIPYLPFRNHQTHMPPFLALKYGKYRRVLPNAA